MSNFYSLNELLSYKKILNFVIGQRGGGKSFNAKKWCINDFLKNGNEFIWVRRYKTETKKLKMTFFENILSEGLFNEHDFKIKGNEILIDNKVAGHFVSLSTSQQEKSTSYPRVTKIVYDEFVVEKSHIRYLPNEVETFLGFMDTVIRNRDNCRVLCIANNIQVTNPYFDYFKIRGDQTKRFVVKDDIIIEYYSNEKFAEERLKTRFGQLIKNTEYGDFSLNNKSLLDNPIFIAEKSPNARPYFNMRWKGMTFGIWYDIKGDEVFFSSKYDPSVTTFSLTNDDHEPMMLHLKGFKKMGCVKNMKYAYSIGKLYFENQMLKRYFLDEILSYI